jgi:pimeloyl-ACP methyl ester carboxylesterase
MSGKPLVVFVPSIFGSHLRDAGGRIWVDEDALAAGGLARLVMTASGVARDGATAAIYRSLVDALEADYEVNAFDYDWRQPIDVSAALIREVMLEAAKEEGRRVHLVGHGWGGVVAARRLPIRMS